MRRVWKWTLPAAGRCTLPMPRGAEVLAVQVQREDVALWAVVDPDAESEPRSFITVGTGHPEVPAKVRYVGTFQLAGVVFVGHVFEDLS